MGTISEQERRLVSGDDDRGGDRQMELVGSEKGIVEGSGKITGWSDSMDRLMDSSPQYRDALRAAYAHFCLPSPHSAIPPERLLSALQYFVQIITEHIDERAGKVCLRPVTQEDVDVISQNDKTLAGTQGRPINFSTFDLYARQVMKRVVLDRGKRLGLFMLGGLVVVHLTKSIVSRIPVIGPLVNTLVPTILAGPAVGVAGALYL